jgi:CRISPR-associated exonuclease Cas4
MLGLAIGAGALFYGQPRRRYPVELTAALRQRTEALAARVHELFAAGRTPLARYEKKCANCSLLLHCLPKTLGKPGSVGRYLDRTLASGDLDAKGGLP